MNGGWLDPRPGSMLLVLLLGLCLGSFLNVVIYRLPRDLSLVRPRSRCPSCGASIRVRHNVPVIGWLVLGGRCADCKATIPLRYPLIEAAGGVLALAATFLFPSPLVSIAALWLFFALLAVFFIDLEHRIIPDEISLGGTALGLLLAHWTIGLVPALIGSVVGAGGLLLTALGYQRLRGQAGMGMGDVKLAAMLGAFLGLKGVILTILLASLLGSALGMSLVLARRAGRMTALPFGSFLAPAGAIALLWGPRIWAWYAGLFPPR